MSHMPLGGHDDEAESRPPDLHVVPRDVSFEHALDETAPKPEPVHDGDGIEIPQLGGERRPIVPEHLQTWAGIKNTASKYLDAARFHTLFHLLRLLPYVIAGAYWACVAIATIAKAQKDWWWLSEQAYLRSKAVVDGNSPEYRSLMRDLRKTRSWRGYVVGAEVFALVLAFVLIAALAPWWSWFIVAAVAMPPLAHHGRPRHRPIVSSAVTTPLVRKISTDAIVRAYEAAKLCSTDPKKPADHLGFGSTMSRDALNKGSQVVVYLPYGGTFAEVVNAKPQIASGLDVAESQVYFTKDKQSERRHTLLVLDTDPLGEPAGRTPLLDCKPRSIWRKIPFGLDQFGRQVAFCLMWYSMLIGAQPRKGKALALDTPVPTPDGWTTMGELRDGDTVFGADGRPCRVVTAHKVRYGRPCYEVEFSDGSVIVADAEHLWQVDTRASRLGAQQRAARKKQNNSLSRDQSHRWAQPQVLTTEELRGSVHIQADLRANYSVRVAAALQAPAADLLVPPYTLGAWLGDGNTNQGFITCQDPEIIAGIECEGERTGLNPSTVAAGKCPGYRIYGLQPRLRRIGVLGNKHIPVAYLRASEDQRRALLAGLLDTDGYCQSTGVVYFAVTSERLARDVRHLVSTLGYKSSLNVKPVKFNGRDHGQQWVVTFTPADKVFRMARKAARQVTKMKASASHRFITDIRPVPSVPVRCITVDSPNSLYLVGETCIPTHNTFSGRLIALFAALDPYVPITIIDGKQSPDWLPFRYIAHRYVRGTVPTKDGDPVEKALDALREIRRWIDEVNEELGTLTVKECPEGKLTEHLHRTNPKLRVRLLVMEEFQVYFELPDQKKNKDFAQLLSEIQALGPSAGVIVVSLSQKPSQVGAGDVQRLFNRYRDNHILRFALRCANRDVSNAILGNEAYGEGYDASGLPLGDEYKGIGILYGLVDEAPTVRTYLADGEDAEVICLAARKLREKARTLSGDALGVDVDDPDSDIVADLLDVIGGDPGIWWEAAAERLTGRFPMRHADATAESVSALARKRSVPSVNVNVGGRVLKGCRKDALERAARQQ